MNIGASVVFAGMSGAAVADAGGLGAVEVKAMRDAGYERGFSVGVTAASSTIGPIIPPSLPLIIYGVVAEVSIDDLLHGVIIQSGNDASVALADLDKEDGTFHPADAQGVFHHGFDRGTFQSILESKGFQDVNFVTAHTVNREGKSYPIFLVTAVKAG